jgi:dTMP kinase
MHNYKGKFIIIDGLDGIGKGVIISTLKSQEKNKIFDLTDFWKLNKKHPEYKLLKPFQIIISSEPTYAEKGIKIRKDIIKKNSDYSALQTARAYSEDRYELYKKIIIPALKDGKTIIQDRSVCSSLVYQTTQSKDKLSMKEILKLKGNKLALNNSPNLLIIPTIKNPEELIDRLSKRKKKDNCIFENIKFQLMLKPIYEGKKLKQLFQEQETEVIYLDAGISIKKTKEQSIKIYNDFFNKQKSASSD